jgi:hypothetical protein
MLYLYFISSALSYEPVTDIKFNSTASFEYNFGQSYTLKYKIFRKSNIYSNDFLSRSVALATSASISKIMSIDRNMVQCKQDEALEIYEISVSELNDDNRFKNIAKFNDQVWGYFDPMVDEQNINIILVTPHSKYENFQILTHEIAHHWYSVYCVGNYSDISTEDFALQIQFSLEHLNEYN